MVLYIAWSYNTQKLLMCAYMACTPNSKATILGSVHDECSTGWTHGLQFWYCMYKTCSKQRFKQRFIVFRLFIPPSVLKPENEAIPGSAKAKELRGELYVF